MNVRRQPVPILIAVAAHHGSVAQQQAVVEAARRGIEERRPRATGARPGRHQEYCQAHAGTGAQADTPAKSGKKVVIGSIASPGGGRNIHAVLTGCKWRNESLEFGLNYV